MVCTCDTTTPCIYPSTNSTCCTGLCSATSSIANNIPLTQKLIWNQVRVPASLYAMNLSALKISAGRLKSNANANNQSSDQATAAIQNHPLPSHGNSSRTTLTSLKPGACMPGGQGVDIKHNSYARYLGRKKGANLRTQPLSQQAANAVVGNKTRMFGLIANSENCCL